MSVPELPDATPDETMLANALVFQIDMYYEYVPFTTKFAAAFAAIEKIREDQRVVE